MSSSTDVSFVSHGVRCAGTLTLPVGDRGHPAVVLAHGFGLTRDVGLPAVAEALAARGVASLTFDYRHHGESAGEPRGLISIRRQQDDVRAAIAYARSLAQLDPARIAVWGYSYGGAHAIEVAARDGRVAAVAARTPFVDGLAKVVTFSPVRLATLVRAGLVDQLHGVLRRAPAYQPLLGPPGSRALYTDPLEVAGYRHLAERSSTWRNRYAPRANLYVATYRATRRAGRLRCPLLVVAAEHDTLALPGTLARLARRAPDVTVARFPADHFSLWTGRLGDDALAREAAWLAERLGAAG